MQDEKQKRERVLGVESPEENLKKLKELKAKRRKEAKAKLRERISLG